MKITYTKAFGGWFRSKLYTERPGVFIKVGDLKNFLQDIRLFVGLYMSISNYARNKLSLETIDYL